MVSWKEAADSHESVASDAFVIPRSDRTGRRRDLAALDRPRRCDPRTRRRLIRSPGRKSVSPGSMMWTLRKHLRAISSMCLSWIVTPCERYTCWTSSTRCCSRASTPLTRRISCGLTEPSVSCWPTLADDHPLGAVDDERALLGHHREVAHEHRLALDLAGVVVDELGRDEQRGRVRHVFVFALVDRGLDLVEARVGERQRHRSGEILDRRELGQHLFEAADGVHVTAGGGDLTPVVGADQPFEGLGLHVEEPRNLERLAELGERNSVGCSRYGARSSSSGLALAGDCQDASFQHLMRLSAWPAPVLRRYICVGSAGVLPVQTAPNGGHATRSLSLKRGSA